MSAYVISSTTMSLVVTAICSKSDWGHQRIDDFAGIKTDSQGAETKIGRALFQMNIDAVDQRYSEKSGDDSAVRYCYRVPDASIRPAAHFKAIESLIYQCSVGDICKRPLYEELRRASGNIAKAIVRAMPAYEKAVW